MSSYPYNVLPEDRRRIDTPILNGNKEIPKFHEALKPALILQCLFGQCYLSRSFLAMFAAKVVFLLIFGYLSFIFGLAVFNRDKIEVWMQISLYVIPLLSFPCGAYIFSSGSYYRMLQRNLTSSVSVRFYVNAGRVSADCDGNHQASAHNVSWLKEISLKSIIYPFSLEFLQWGSFLIYALNKNDKNFINTFVSTVKLFKNEECTWKVLYIINWTLSIYIVGFVSYQFVFVSRLIVKDTVNLMSLFGNTSYLKLYPVYDFHLQKNCCFRLCKCILNFITMDLFNSFADERIYTECADVSRLDHGVLPSYSFSPYRVLSSPFEEVHQSPHEDKKTSIKEIDEEKDVVIKNQLTPSEACQVFSTFIAEVESLTSIFVPFTIILLFFGVANLITHVGLFIKNDNGHLSTWTLFRTILFLLVALRMIICVVIVSSVLGKLPAHVNLINTAGKLGYNDHMAPSWKDFIELLSSYHLGKRSFGFPMTIRQIASFVTAIYMGFYIVLSVMKSNQK